MTITKMTFFHQALFRERHHGSWSICTRRLRITHAPAVPVSAPSRVATNTSIVRYRPWSTTTTTRSLSIFSVWNPYRKRIFPVASTWTLSGYYQPRTRTRTRFLTRQSSPSQSHHTMPWTFRTYQTPPMIMASTPS